MTKAELIAAIAKELGGTKADAERHLNATLEVVKRTLGKGGAITLVGFGTFTVTKRKARLGRNPQTGESMKIPASKVPVFRAGKNLKEAVDKNKRKKE